MILGQATATVELLNQTPVDVVLAPIGGGGLLAGACLATRGQRVRVIGAEPSRADDAARSLAAGRRVHVVPDTMADGLRMQIGDRPLAVCLATPGLRIVTVPEAAIEPAMRAVYHHTGEVIEPSCAVAVAALRTEPDAFAGLHVGVIVTGSNVDRTRFDWFKSTA